MGGRSPDARDAHVQVRRQPARRRASQLLRILGRRLTDIVQVRVPSLCGLAVGCRSLHARCGAKPTWLCCWIRASPSIRCRVKPVAGAPGMHFGIDARPVKVLESLDLSLLSRELACTSSKTFLLDFGGRGPTCITLTAPRSLLFLGEPVPLTLKVRPHHHSLVGPRCSSFGDARRVDQAAIGGSCRRAALVVFTQCRALVGL